MEYLHVLKFQKKMIPNDQGGEEEEYLIAEDVPDDTTLARTCSD